jgi:hypothetical protein
MAELSLEQLNELRTRQERLLPELEPYLVELWSGRLTLEHPLVKDPFIDPECCGHVNQLYKEKTAQAEKYRRAAPHTV